jgi:excisionase family DNA binding protein
MIKSLDRSPARQASTNGLKPKELLTVRDCLEELGIDRTTFWDWRTKRGLRSIHVGGVLRIRRSDLEAFLTRHTTAAGGESVRREK